jgi:hypothetical protein
MAYFLKTLPTFSSQLLQISERTFLFRCHSRSIERAKKVKVVPLHAMEALWVRGGIAPTLS